MKANPVKDCPLFYVQALDMKKRQWVLVIREPVPRGEAALVIAEQWKKGMLAKLVPTRKVEVPCQNA